MKRKLDPEAVKRAEAKAGKEIVRKIYFEWKVGVQRMYPITTDKVRQSIVDVIAAVKASTAPGWVQLPYIRGFEIMLEKVGGAMLSADELFDNAIKVESGESEEGPTDESIRQAMKLLGMKELPTGDDASASPDSVNLPDSAPHRRLRTSYGTDGSSSGKAS